ASAGELAYTVRVVGVPAAELLAITLNRAGQDGIGPTLFQLAGSGRARADGRIPLPTAERAELESGRLVLTVYTRAQPHGALRARLVLPRT
ncbi:MAG: CHRD domain-containing protein, partial [Longimicrobiales bacterium]